MRRKRTCCGFSVLELLIVMGAVSVMAAVSVPLVHRTLKTYRLAGDARGISQTLTLAKMRAASNFTLEAVDWDSSSGSFSVKYFQKDPDLVLSLDDLLTRLGEEDAAAARVAHLHLFGGISVEEAGETLGLSRAVAYRNWKYARAWLREALEN